MEYYITDDIESGKYEKLIDYLLEKCDAVSFRLPKYNEFLVTNENKEALGGTIGDHYFDHSLDKDVTEYMKNVKPILKRFQHYFIKEYDSVSYGYIVTGYVNSVKIMRFEPRVAQLLKKEKSLFSWNTSRSNPLPCDLCFYADHKPVLITDAGEFRAFFYAEDDTDLNELGIEYEDAEKINEDLYILDY